MINKESTAHQLVLEMVDYLPQEGGSYGHVDSEFRSEWLARAKDYLASELTRRNPDA